VSVQQCGRRSVIEPLETQLGQPGVAERAGEAVPHRGHQHDRLGVQPPRDEREDVSAGAVEPVGILHDQQGGDVRRGLAQEVQGGERDEEQWVRIGRRSRCRPAKASCSSDSTPAGSSSLE
jgi:hypothetical protein